MNYYHQTLPSSSEQAEAMLQAWVCGDIKGLEKILDHITSSRVRMMDRMENARFDLLRVIAQGLKACPDRYASGKKNPLLRLYVDLLNFLSTSSPCYGKHVRDIDQEPMLQSNCQAQHGYISLNN